MNSVKNVFPLTHLDYVCSDTRIVPFAGLVIPGRMLDAIGFDKAVNKSTPSSKEYKNSEILKAMLIGILCGNSDFESIHETDDDQEFYCNAMRMAKLPSEATMRQRMDEIGSSLKYPLRDMTINLFKKYSIEPSPLENGYIPIDIDVSPFINEKCNKEGISKTYKRKDGYAPIFAYIGTEGYLLACELREGKQHCQKNTPDFLKEVLDLARKITDKPLLVRLDSGNDSADNIGIFMEKCYSGDSVHFIIKRNIRKESPAEWLENFREVCTNVSTPREGKSIYIGETYRDVTYKINDDSESKTVGIRTIYEITERLSDHDGQCYVEPKIECNMYSVNVDFNDEQIIELYHNHGEMEQYHSEIKTDMNCELLPSGKFETNELVLELIQLAYNMLRIIGQTSLSLDEVCIPLKRPVKRRRLRTVLERVIMAPGFIKKHARKSLVDLGTSNPWRNAIIAIANKFKK